LDTNRRREEDTSCNPMRITKVRIRNFRSIKSLDLDLDDTTVFIGPNNAGKTAILDSVRIALSRRWGQRGTGFTEYDVHSPDPDGDPRTLPSVSIEIMLEEPAAGIWPDDLVAALEDIMAIGATKRNQIALRIGCAWDADTETFEPSWEFLDAAGAPLTGKSQRATNLSGFFGYLPLFWLGALRDAADEFSPRSQHWGRLLRSVRIPDELEAEVKAALDALDVRMLAADARLGKIADTIGQATNVAEGDTPGSAKLRMLPMNMWDLLSRAGVVLRNETIRPWLPLGHHGQGLQSLSVIFLFEAAVGQQLAEDEHIGMEPVFAIEEPEAHLHPQAARMLWERISVLPGQKLVTTHSPYFVQHVPLHNLRIVRLRNGATEVVALPRRIVSTLPWTANVETLASGAARMLECDPETNCVASKEWFSEAIADRLAHFWNGDSQAAARRAAVMELRHACRILVSADDEAELGFMGRRVRGEIFFARRWILVEGPSEYLLLHALGKAMDWVLDRHGVAVIDFQNNGNAGVYPALAEAFGIPWRMITDGDVESTKFKAQILKRGFTEADIAGRFSTLPAPNTLEDQLLADGHEKLLRDTLADIGSPNAKTCPIDEFRGRLKNAKTAYMAALAPKIAADPALAALMPDPFVALIQGLKDGTI
jgi:putative ATP-dependent endonuclease of OLD family